MSEQDKREVVPFGRLSIQQLKTLWGDSLQHLEKLSEKPLAKVYVARTPVEADYLVGVLNQEGIPALLQSYRDTAFDGLFMATRGAGAIITLEEDAYRALTLIETVVELIEKEGGLPDDADVSASDPTIPQDSD